MDKCLAVSLLATATAVVAQTPAERITAKADRLELDQLTGVQQLTGNVLITQGDISIEGDNIKVATRNGAISRIFGSGNPIKFQQMLANGEVVTTESSEIDYLTSSWTLVFRGNVVLQRSEWQLGGHVVEYNIRNRNFSARGTDSNANSDTGSVAAGNSSRVSITYHRGQ